MAVEIKFQGKQPITFQNFFSFCFMPEKSNNYHILVG